MGEVQTILAIVGAIVGIGGPVIGGFYAFITRTNTGREFWMWAKPQLLNFISRLWQRRVSIGVLTVIAIAGVVGAFLVFRFVLTTTIVGTVYYKGCGDSKARSPVANVRVHVTGRPDLKSEATRADGSFTIRVPRNIQPTHLRAQFGGQDFTVPVDPAGEYAIIDRECSDTRDIRQVQTPWKHEIGECLLEGPSPRVLKRFELDTSLSGAEGKDEALLTVELLNADNVEIANAFVLSPSTQFYQNHTVPGQDLKKARTWKFVMPRDGLRIKVEICLGSNRSITTPPESFYTSYELR